MAGLWELQYCKLISNATNKILLKVLCSWVILSSPAASRTLQQPSHTLLGFLLKLGSCPKKGLAFFHCSSISIASKENLCRVKGLAFFYNRANCLKLPHSVKCLLCCFTTQQERKGQTGPTAEQRCCHWSIHLKPRFQWDTTASQFFPLPPGDRHQVVN